LGGKPLGEIGQDGGSANDTFEGGAQEVPESKEGFESVKVEKQGNLP